MNSEEELDETWNSPPLPLKNSTGVNCAFNSLLQVCANIPELFTTCFSLPEFEFRLLTHMLSSYKNQQYYRSTGRTNRYPQEYMIDTQILRQRFSGIFPAFQPKNDEQLDAHELLSLLFSRVNVEIKVNTQTNQENRESNQESRTESNQVSNEPVKIHPLFTKVGIQIYYQDDGVSDVPIVPERLHLAFTNPKHNKAYTAVKRHCPSVIRNIYDWHLFIEIPEELQLEEFKINQEFKTSNNLIIPLYQQHQQNTYSGRSTNVAHSRLISPYFTAGCSNRRLRGGSYSPNDLTMINENNDYVWISSREQRNARDNGYSTDNSHSRENDHSEENFHSQPNPFRKTPPLRLINGNNDNRMNQNNENQTNQNSEQSTNEQPSANAQKFDLFQRQLSRCFDRSVQNSRDGAVTFLQMEDQCLHNYSAIRQITHFYEAPKFLCLCVQRLKYIEQQNKQIIRMKVNSDFPIAFTFHLNQIPNAESSTYSLQGFISHVGQSFEHGHYIAYLRKATGQWYYCSDISVQSKTEEEVMKAAEQSYILFYRKVA